VLHSGLSAAERAENWRLLARGERSREFLEEVLDGLQVWGKAKFDDLRVFSELVSSLNDVNSTVGTIGNIVNLAQKIWSIIQENQPVVNITTNYANAVPYGTSNWTQLENWSKPATKKYSFSMKNAFGSEVVKIAYQVDYTYGGNYNGKGKFLTGVTIEPLSVTTAWGYKVNLTSEVPDSTVANVGTQSDPVASMQVQLDWTVHTALKDTTSKAIYYVQGDGLLQEMGTPFKNAAALKETKRSDAAAAQISGAQFN